MTAVELLALCFRLNVSEVTVKVNHARMMRKLELRSPVEVARLADSISTDVATVRPSLVRSRSHFQARSNAGSLEGAIALPAKVCGFVVAKMPSPEDRQDFETQTLSCDQLVVSAAGSPPRPPDRVNHDLGSRNLPHVTPGCIGLAPPLVFPSSACTNAYSNRL
ncbi:LuxR C-terminal-related transcriptional regulator [Bradyrhizobium sp. UFLA05-153]